MTALYHTPPPCGNTFPGGGSPRRPGHAGFAALPPALYGEAARFLAQFIAAGRAGQEKGPARPAPRLLDWQQDAPLIIAGVNRVAGQEVRALPFLHWWSFLTWFSGIGEGTLATVVSIRDKLRRGKKLEKWENEFYRQNKERVELKTRFSKEELEEQERLQKLLGE